MSECWVALGGNLGDVEQTFHSALDRIGAHPGVRVRCLSSIHRTVPVGNQAGGDFRNAAAGLETELAPLDLLDLLQDCETALGRVRLGHWGPRTLDLDLLLYGDAVLDVPRLRVPHPHFWFRRFVLDPLVEIAADVVHPVKGRSIRELQSRLLVRPLICALSGRTDEIRRECRAELAPEFPEVELIEWNAWAVPLEPALIAWLGPEAGVCDSAATFSALPSVPRLDVAALASETDTPSATLRHVLHAALGR